MDFNYHVQRTKEKIGIGCPEVHRYLDQYFPIFRTGTHRLIFHHQVGVQKIVQLFSNNYGYEGAILVRQAAELHVIDDIGYVPESWYGMEDMTFFLDDKEEREFENCLGLEFPEYFDIVMLK